MNQCSSSPFVTSTLCQVTKCVQEYHMNVCGSLVSKECATYQMQQICSSCYNPLCCVTFAPIYVSQPKYLTYAQWHCIVLALASSELTSNNSTNKKMISSTWRASKLWKASVIGRCSNDATLLRVIVTSPSRRWKLLVSLCHLFANANISSRSLVFNEHAIKGFNPMAIIKPSISGTDLSNFKTFLPWDDNFSSGHSWRS